jgi:hypothetical protein
MHGLELAYCKGVEADRRRGRIPANMSYTKPHLCMWDDPAVEVGRTPSLVRLPFDRGCRPAARCGGMTSCNFRANVYLCAEFPNAISYSGVWLALGRRDEQRTAEEAAARQNASRVRSKDKQDGSGDDARFSRRVNEKGGGQGVGGERRRREEGG